MASFGGEGAEALQANWHSLLDIRFGGSSELSRPWTTHGSLWLARPDGGAGADRIVHVRTGRCAPSAGRCSCVLALERPLTFRIICPCCSRCCLPPCFSEPQLPAQRSRCLCSRPDWFPRIYVVRRGWGSAGSLHCAPVTALERWKARHRWRCFCCCTAGGSPSPPTLLQALSAWPFVPGAPMFRPRCLSRTPAPGVFCPALSQSWLSTSRLLLSMSLGSTGRQVSAGVWAAGQACRRRRLDAGRAAGVPRATGCRRPPQAAPPQHITC